MKTNRRGFTLYELLIVLAILAILLGLLLPAIFKVRAAASRMSSQNNLKQIGLALHNYESAFNLFPPGVDDNGFSVSARILPFIEQDNLFKLLDFKKAVADQPAVVRATFIKTYLSPQDPVMIVKEGLGSTNYLYSAGTKYPLEKNDGIFFKDSKTRLVDITDGTSNTVMAGETLKGDGMTKAMTVQRQHVQYDKDALKDLKDESGVDDFKNDKNVAGNRCASWLDGSFLQGTYTATRQPNDARPDVNCGGAGGLSALRSLDDAIVQTGFCDGSVRAIKSTVNADTWKALATRAGGEVIMGGF